jgi:hypothetical protein
MDTGTRTGISYLGERRLRRRHRLPDQHPQHRLGLEAKGSLYSQTVLGSRPTAGVAGRFWKDSGSLNDGSSTTTTAPHGRPSARAPPPTGPLPRRRCAPSGPARRRPPPVTTRTASARIVGAGGAASLNVGTTTGTVAAGDAGSPAVFIQERLLLVVTVSGSLTVKWGQVVSNAIATTMNTGSSLIATRIA